MFLQSAAECCGMRIVTLQLLCMNNISCAIICGFLVTKIAHKHWWGMGSPIAIFTHLPVRLSHKNIPKLHTYWQISNRILTLVQIKHHTTESSLKKYFVIQYISELFDWYHQTKWPVFLGTVNASWRRKNKQTYKLLWIINCISLGNLVYKNGEKDQ